MLKSIFFFLVAIADVWAYNLSQYYQNDYIGISERLEVVKHDKNYIDHPICHNFKYNRTHFGHNFTWTFITNLGDDVLLDVQGYKFVSNEYRLFPIYFPVKLCDVVGKNLFGMDNLYKCGRMFRCPLKKGSYSFCNWSPDFSRFPPHFPVGSYLADVKWIYMQTEIMQNQYYFTVKDKTL